MANKNTFNGRKRVNPALAAMNRQQHDILLIRSSNKANLLLSLMVLHSKFDFTKDDSIISSQNIENSWMHTTVDMLKIQRILKMFFGMSVG